MIFKIEDFPLFDQVIDRTLRFRPRPRGYVFKSLRFHFTENGMKVLRPHDRFQFVLPVHTEFVHKMVHRLSSTQGKSKSARKKSSPLLFNSTLQ